MTLTYPKLKAHLASGDLASTYVLSGEQELIREQAAHEIEVAALGEADPQLNLEKFDGENASVEQLILALNTLPMLGGRRVVVVRRALRVVEIPRRRGDGEPKKGSTIDAIVEYLGNPSPQTVLIMELEKSPDRRRKAWKQIEKRVTLVHCNPLKDHEVEDWIAEQAGRRNLELGKEELRYFVTEFGSDLRRQLSELEKLSLYAGGRKLEGGDLGVLLGRGRAQSIFRFTDAVAARDAPTALKQLGRLVTEGESPLGILALLDRTVGHMLAVKEMRRRRGSRGELTQVLGIQPWLVDKLARDADRFEESELSQALAVLARFDRAMKTSRTPGRLLLEGLVISLCGGRVSSRR